VPDLQAAAAQDRPESGRNHPWGAAMITIPLEILEKIQSHRPHLGAMIGNLKAATSPALARKHRARAEAPARLPNKDNHG
jgi:hypothetical protein